MWHFFYHITVHTVKTGDVSEHNVNRCASKSATFFFWLIFKFVLIWGDHYFVVRNPGIQFLAPPPPPSLPIPISRTEMEYATLDLSVMSRCGLKFYAQCIFAFTHKFYISEATVLVCLFFVVVFCFCFCFLPQTPPGKAMFSISDSSMWAHMCTSAPL